MARRSTQSQRLRNQAFERDHGICQCCGADCEKMKRVYHSIVFHDAQQSYGEITMSDGQVFWEADHIIEVAENGSDSPRNIQTLCIPCHAEKTRLWMINRKRETTVVAKRPEALAAIEPQEMQVTNPDYAEQVAEMDQRVEYVRDFCRQFILNRMNRSGQMWPKAMEPIDSDAAYDPWIAH